MKHSNRLVIITGLMFDHLGFCEMDCTDRCGWGVGKLPSWAKWTGVRAVTHEGDPSAKLNIKINYLVAYRGCLIFGGPPL